MTLLKDQLKGFVPTEQTKEIIKDVAKGSTVLKLADVQPMTSDKKTFNVQTSGAGAYWVGEGERIQTSGATWIHPTLEAKKLGVIIVTTKEKLEDSVIDVFGEMKEDIAEAFYTAIDKAVLFGTSSPFATNVFKSAETAGNKVENTGSSTFDLVVSDAMALVEAEGKDVTAFVADSSIKNVMRKLRDTNGNQLYFTGTEGNEFYNLPIEFTKNSAFDKTKAELLGGDFKKYCKIGIRDGLSYEILTEATLQGTVGADEKPISLAEQDLIAIKATMRLGSLIVKDDAFTAVVPKTVTP